MSFNDPNPAPVEPTFPEADTGTTTPPSPSAPIRTFVYNGKVYDDPDPALSVDDVRAYLADFYEELTNAEAEEQRRADGTLEVTFRRRIGTKG